MLMVAGISAQGYGGGTVFPVQIAVAGANGAPKGSDMRNPGIPIIPFETQDQLAEIQHAIYAAVRSQQLDNDFVFGRLRALLGTTIPDDGRTKLTPGLLGFLEFELRRRLYDGILDPDLALQALTDLLKDGRQLVADRFTSQLTDDLAKLAKEFPKEHAAYLLVPQLRGLGTGSNEFPNWLPPLAKIDSHWGYPDMSHPAHLSERLQRYINKRKQTASRVENQMVAAGFELNTPLIKPVQHQAATESSMFAVTFNFWDYLRMAGLKQSRQAA